MRFINPIYLITQTNKTINEVGDLLYENKERKVLAHKESTRQSEFYQAQAVGIKPEITFIIRFFEYKNEEKLKYNNKIYNILRAYDKGNGTIEIICVGDVNNATTT